MSQRKTIARRSFLIGSAAVLGGVAFGVYSHRQAHPNPLLQDLADGASAITPYVRIDAQGVTIITPRAEMGQGIHTTLAALVAEELDLAWDSIRIAHGVPAAAYYNHAAIAEGVPFAALDHGPMAQAMRGTMGVVAKFMAMQVTGGSSSVPDAYDKMRQAGAAARFALVAAAADQLGVPAGQLKTADGAVLAPDGRRLAYTSLAPAAARIALPDKLPLKPRAQWRYLGQSMPRLDMVAKCTGTAPFGIDLRQPEMVFATVRLNPALGAPLLRFDAGAALQQRGVLQVVDLPGGIGVIADNTWRAFQAAKAVQCDWADAIHPPSTAALMEAIVASFVDKHQDSQLRDDGDVDQALGGGPDQRPVLEAEYRVPFLAHAPMEPMNAVAWLRHGRLDIWSGVQSPTAARDQAAKLAGLEPAQVHVHAMLMGGSFGRRLETDYVLQAVQLAHGGAGQPCQADLEPGRRHDPGRLPPGRHRAPARQHGQAASAGAGRACGQPVGAGIPRWPAGPAHAGAGQADHRRCLRPALRHRPLPRHGLPHTGQCCR